MIEMRKKTSLAGIAVFTLLLIYIAFFSTNSSILPSQVYALIGIVCPDTNVKGDANCDQQINDQDYAIWRSKYLTQQVVINAQVGDADFNDDNKIDMKDYEIWRRGKLANVPSPTLTSAYTCPKSGRVTYIGNGVYGCEHYECRINSCISVRTSMMDDAVDTCTNVGGPCGYYYDGATPAVTQAPLKPDLIVENIQRDAFGYKAYICNTGGADSANKFTIKTTNLSNNKSFSSNSFYPYAVPAGGTCLWTGSVSCSLIDSSCTEAVSIQITIDENNTIPESNEANNTFTKQFAVSPQPDLVIENLVRDNSAYTYTVCNRGAAPQTNTTFQITAVNGNNTVQQYVIKPVRQPLQNECFQVSMPCNAITNSCNEQATIETTIDSANQIFETNENNNLYTKSFDEVFAGTPDLIIEDARMSATGYVFKVCNRGTYTSAKFEFLASAYSQGKNYRLTGIEQPGTNACKEIPEIPCTALFSSCAASIGYSISAAVDTNQLIPEISDTNNFYDYEIQ